eukprot:288287_1
MTPIINHLNNVFDNHQHAHQVPSIQHKNKIFDKVYYINFLPYLYELFGNKTFPDFKSSMIKTFNHIYMKVHQTNQSTQQQQRMDDIIQKLAASVKISYENKCYETISSRAEYQQKLLHQNGWKKMAKCIERNLMLDCEPNALLPSLFRLLSEALVGTSTKLNLMYIQYGFTKIKFDQCDNENEYMLTKSLCLLDLQFSKLKSDTKSTWDQTRENVVKNTTHPIMICTGSYELNELLYQWKGMTLPRILIRKKIARKKYRRTRKICKKIVKKKKRPNIISKNIIFKMETIYIIQKRLFIR